MTAGPAMGVENFLGTVGAMVAIAVGVLCGYLLVDSVKPLYTHTVQPALELIPFQLHPSDGGSRFGRRRSHPGEGGGTGHEQEPSDTDVD
jgi:hypothetical protein